MNFSFLFLFAYGLSLAWAASIAELMQNLKTAPSGSLFYRFHPVFYRGTEGRSLIKRDRITRSYSTVDGTKVSKDDLLARLKEMESDYQLLLVGFPAFKQSNPKRYGSVDISKASGIVLKSRSSILHPYDRSLQDVTGNNIDFRRMYDILVKALNSEHRGWISERMMQNIRQSDDPELVAKELRGHYLELDDYCSSYIMNLVEWNRPSSLAIVLSHFQMSPEKRSETLTWLLTGGLYKHRPEVCEMLLRMTDFELDADIADYFDKDAFWNGAHFFWQSKELIDLAMIRRGVLDFIQPTGHEMLHCFNLHSALTMISFLRHFPSPSKEPKSSKLQSSRRPRIGEMEDIEESSHLLDLLWCLNYNKHFKPEEKELLGNRIRKIRLMY
jgi:hypothetical protein